jgi:hypothetical protein
MKNLCGIRTWNLWNSSWQPVILGRLVSVGSELGFHFESLCSKVSQTVGVLDRVKDFLPTSVLRLIYFSLLQSKLQYGITIWGVAAKKYMETLLILQKRALKFFCPLNEKFQMMFRIFFFYVACKMNVQIIIKCSKS